MFQLIQHYGCRQHCETFVICSYASAILRNLGDIFKWNAFERSGNSCIWCNKIWFALVCTMGEMFKSWKFIYEDCWWMCHVVIFVCMFDTELLPEPASTCHQLSVLWGSLGVTWINCFRYFHSVNSFWKFWIASQASELRWSLLKSLLFTKSACEWGKYSFNPIMEKRWSYEGLISTLGFPTLERQHLYIVLLPSVFPCTSMASNPFSRVAWDCYWCQAPCNWRKVHDGNVIGVTCLWHQHRGMIRYNLPCHFSEEDIFD